ncbi:hypothetical protein Hanom_Chr15g01390431 [Helianthus anomalus]
MDVGETLVRIPGSTFFFLFLNFNTIFQIIKLGPFKFNFQLHTFFWEKGHKILLRLRPPKWLSRPCKSLKMFLTYMIKTSEICCAPQWIFYDYWFV